MSPMTTNLDLSLKLKELVRTIGEGKLPSSETGVSECDDDLDRLVDALDQLDDGSIDALLEGTGENAATIAENANLILELARPDEISLASNTRLGSFCISSEV